MTHRNSHMDLNVPEKASRILVLIVSIVAILIVPHFQKAYGAYHTPPSKSTPAPLPIDMAIRANEPDGSPGEQKLAHLVLPSNTSDDIESFQPTQLPAPGGQRSTLAL